jgi:hypothetical protein
MLMLHSLAVQSNARGKPYHAMFRLSDDTLSGLVSIDTFKHTLRMMGCSSLSDDAASIQKVYIVTAHFEYVVYYYKCELCSTVLLNVYGVMMACVHVCGMRSVHSSFNHMISLDC